jgi:hypothetical protein
LVEAAFRIDRAHRLEHDRHSHRRELRCQDGLFPRRRDERHRGKVVDLVWTELLEGDPERRLVEHIGANQMHVVTDAGEVLVVLEALASPDTENLVVVRKQQLGEIRAVLTSDAGYESAATRHAHTLGRGWGFAL